MSDCIKYKVLRVIEKINWLCEGKNINEYSSVMVDLKDVKFLIEYIEMLEHKLENKEDKKIDIQSIELFDEIRDISTWSNDTLSFNQRSIISKVNKLVKAIKQLDKKIKQEVEDK